MRRHEVARYGVAELRLETAPPELPVDVIFIDPRGVECRVPAFVSDGELRVRYSSGDLGRHHYRGETMDGSALPGCAGIVEVSSCDDSRELALHGPVQVARDGRHLEHADGTPFLWLADTWWYGFTERLSQAEFRALAETRSQQGFSVVQIVAGLYPETSPFTPESRSESGWVWHKDFSEPNTDWFDEADRRIVELVEHGLVPCIVGSWAHYFGFMDPGQMRRHWRELLARWGAYPVVWCLAGEPPFTSSLDDVWHRDDHQERMPEDQSDELASALTTEDALARLLIDPESALIAQLRQLNELARSVRKIEAFGRPISLHSVPGIQPWHYLEDESVVDLWLLQTGHQGANSLVPSVNAVHEALAHDPSKPVIIGEVCYEGIAGSSWQDIQRFLYWSSLLSGTAGHSYGAHGIWNFTTTEFPGFYSGLATMWQEAVTLPGAAQVGAGRRLLIDLPWNEFQPHPEWISPHQQASDRCLPYAAGLDAGPRVFYIPSQAIVRNQFSLTNVELHRLGTRPWRAELIDPRTGATEQEFIIEPELDGTSRLRCGYLGRAPLPSWEDWLLVLRREG